MDDSSATATPEPGTIKPGKQTLNPPSSRIEQDDNSIISNQIEIEHEEKGKTKKAGKIAIEEVDFVSTAETKVRISKSYRGTKIYHIFICE